jgi:hypothetical protein
VGHELSKALVVFAVPCALAFGSPLTLPLALIACGADQTDAKTADDAKAATADTGKPDADQPPPSTSSSKKDDKKDDDLNDAQREQMEIALRRGGDKASNCDRVVPGTAVGEGEVKVTFDGKKGRAIDVAVPAPWAGTDAEQCIKRSFVGEIIVPFDGQLEVPYTVKIGNKNADAGKNAKGQKKTK